VSGKTRGQADAEHKEKIYVKERNIKGPEGLASLGIITK